MNLRLVKCVQLWLHCQLLLVTVSATAFDAFDAFDDGDHDDEATFDMDEIGCPGIPTLQSVDLKTVGIKYSMHFLAGRPF